MKEAKELTRCVVPFIVAAMFVYPFMAIIGGDTDPFLWHRDDCIFYFVCVISFGFMMFARLLVLPKEQM